MIRFEKVQSRFLVAEKNVLEIGFKITVRLRSEIYLSLRLPMIYQILWTTGLLSITVIDA